MGRRRLRWGMLVAPFLLAVACGEDAVSIDGDDGGAPDGSAVRDSSVADSTVVGDTASPSDSSVLDVGDAADAHDAADAYEAGVDAANPANPIAELVIAETHSCARFVDGRVKCWGVNTAGELGLGDKVSRGDGPGEMGDALPYVDFGVGRTAKQLTAGGTHTCALLDNDTVKCWGTNLAGQIGQGDKVTRGDNAGEMGDNLAAVDLGGNVKSVTAGYLHTCAILMNDTVKCWGDNGHGELGLGDTNRRGDGAGEMGANLPAVDLGAGRTAKAISTIVTIGATCALLDNATVKCWGANGLGQLGQGDTIQRGDGPNEMGDNLLPLDLGAGRTAKDVAGSCAVLDNDTLKCWGNGVGDAAGEMGDNLPSINVGAGRTVKVVTAGRTSWCAHLDDDSLKCWGGNEFGQLGQGNMTFLSVPAAVDLGAGLTVKRLAGSTAYSHGAILSNGSVKVWGWNHGSSAGVGGQLGQGDLNDRGDEPNEMGDNLMPIRLVGP